MTEASVEREIQAKGLTAPRVTPDDIEATIKSADFHVFPGSQLTVCCITLINGFTVTGTSACASPENFDRQVGENIAFGNARREIWTLEGYLLKQKLHEAG